MDKRHQEHHVPQALNALVIGLQLTAIAACVWISRSASGWMLVPLALVFGLVMNSVYSIIHEAEHRMLFATPWVNEIAGTAMALFFPAPFHLLRQGHLGHHMRNRSDDEAFDLYFDGEHPIWKALQLYGILTGFYWLVAVLANFVVLAFPFVLRRENFEFDRPSAAFMEALNPRYRQVIRLEAMAA